MRLPIFVCTDSMVEDVYVIWMRLQARCSFPSLQFRIPQSESTKFVCDKKHFSTALCNIFFKIYTSKVIISKSNFIIKILKKIEHNSIIIILIIIT